ncbi:MAG: endolytic transglycosylase MltG [Oligoflexia bacterium]|nr:endolytic transglycosylase MltG [Oligoflexia bacterium]
MGKIFITLMLISVFLVVPGYVYYNIYIWEFRGGDKFFEVKEGEAFSKVNYKLQKEGIVADARIFYRYAQVMDATTSIKSGVYTIPDRTNMKKLLEILTIGDLSAIAVTVPEGKNIYEIGKILEENGLVKNRSEFINKVKDKNFLQSIGLPYNSAEGFLYPDTYRFSQNVSVETIVKTMNREFNKRIKAANFNNSSLSFLDTLILASIVEKETAVALERPRVAGVFFNRLNKKMRLQSDPTTIYGIFERYDGKLHKEDLNGVTPYNTYKIYGLPPTPICNPSLAAIEAVLAPEKHEYIYFVSKNNGTHLFTVDYNDHVNNVNTYQKNMVNNQKK